MRALWLLFVFVPLAEAYLLLWLSRVTSFQFTVGVVLVTATTGAFLAKRQGLRAYREWQQALAAGKTPEIGLVEGSLILVGGLLLLTPGLLTDSIGLSLLLPFTRRRLARFIKARLNAKLAAMVPPGSGGTSGGVPRPTIEGQGRSLDE